MSRLGHGMLAVAIVAWLAAVSLGAPDAPGWRSPPSAGLGWPRS